MGRDGAGHVAGRGWHSAPQTHERAHTRTHAHACAHALAQTRTTRACARPQAARPTARAPPPHAYAHTHTHTHTHNHIVCHVWCRLHTRGASHVFVNCDVCPHAISNSLELPIELLGMVPLLTCRVLAQALCRASAFLVGALAAILFAIRAMLVAAICRERLQFAHVVPMRQTY